MGLAAGRGNVAVITRNNDDPLRGGKHVSSGLNVWKKKYNAKRKSL